MEKRAYLVKMGEARNGMSIGNFEATFGWFKRYIIRLCNRDWNVSFAQVMRGNNGVADRLSKTALEGDIRVKRLDDPPLEVLPLLSIEVSGLR
ncbi:hypothetical protein V6N12_020560 [Hibiscus sabdariffa]|uniref:RNase H type-1 domain-containing protein n=1 Tax=Hibiscus sabdariffa TaxID=183260 RepID=A0ABR2D141_9ROSI